MEPGRDPITDGIVNVNQLEPLAQRILDGPVWDYVSGGAGDETTLALASQHWNAIQLAPHTLVDVAHIDTGISLFGLDLPFPIALAPTSLHAAYTANGESATLAGAKAAHALYVQSSLGSTPLDQVGAAAAELKQPWWFQLYVQEDREFTYDLVSRAIGAGAKALVVTVDTPSLGARDRDKRNNLGSAAGQVYPILDGSPVRPDPLPPHRRVYNPHLSPSITWADFALLAEKSTVPVIPKGILRPDDADRAVDAGAQGILVSNHGARNLDTVPTTAQALPGVVAAVRGRVPVLVDGGIRRGTDIAKALCLGASAVFIGRPYIWGLATYGAAGVTHAVEILRTELEMAMALLGAPTIADLTPDLLWQHQPE